MSFSSDVKKELLGQVPRSRHCQLAELAGIINMDGAIDKDTGCLVLESENELVIHKYEVLMKKAFSVDAGSPLTQGDTKRIMSALKLEKLPDVLKETARLRLEYPEATLKELGGYFDPPVGKSGVNHRLKKLSAIAEELR